MNKEVWRHAKLEPTLESFRLCVKRLKVNDGDYHVNLRRGELILFRVGFILKLKVGDGYEYRLPEKLEDIG